MYASYDALLSTQVIVTKLFFSVTYIIIFFFFSLYWIRIYVQFLHWINLAKLLLSFTKTSSLYDIRVDLAKGEICMRFGKMKGSSRHYFLKVTGKRHGVRQLYRKQDVLDCLCSLLSYETDTEVLADFTFLPLLFFLPSSWLSALLTNSTLGPTSDAEAVDFVVLSISTSLRSHSDTWSCLAFQISFQVLITPSPQYFRKAS